MQMLQFKNIKIEFQLMHIYNVTFLKTFGGIKLCFNSVKNSLVPILSKYFLG